MGQDIREMMKKETLEQPKLSKGHEARFEAKLEKAFQSKKKKNTSFFWLKIAASVILCLGIGYVGLKELNEEGTVDTEIVDIENAIEPTTPQLTIGDISPDLKKIEEFYTTGINVQLASLQINDGNKELIEGYMRRLAELDKEYKRLTLELNEVGPTEATINALIDNLKLRMDLLFKLKNKLKELKELENEQINI